MDRQKLKVALLRLCDRTEIPVQQSLLLSTIPMERCNSLKEAVKKKEFSSDIKTKYMDKFPQVLTAKCQCTRHRAGRGCMSDSFIKDARINHFCCLQQCQNPTEYATRLRSLSKYHVKDILEWEDGNCDFHPSKMCTCKMCDGDEDPECEGSPYKTKHPLSCEYHWLAHVLECEKRAGEADLVIHLTMGRGHSNLCEAGFTVLPLFHSKT